MTKMKSKTKQTIIQTETVIYAKEKVCPLHRDLGDEQPIFDVECKECDFFISPNKHGWIEREIPIIEESTDHEDDSSYYTKVINCIKCNSKIVFGSSYSCLSYGYDEEHCQKCGTYHYFKDYKKGLKTAIFLVPLFSSYSAISKDEGK